MFNPILKSLYSELDAARLETGLDPVNGDFSRIEDLRHRINRIEHKLARDEQEKAHRRQRAVAGFLAYRARIKHNSAGAQ